MLQFELFEPNNDVVIRSFETCVSSSRPFYVRCVDGDSQIMLQGTVEKAPDGKFSVEYIYEEAELRDDPAPRKRVNGSETLDRDKRSYLGLRGDGSELNRKYAITIRNFVPAIGFRDTNSSITVELVDEKGRPVEGAKAGF